VTLRPLPSVAADLLAVVEAPPRLVAHLTLVHDVAAQLVPALRQAFPAINVDEQAVLFGAATHDIGKAEATSELSAPGKSHEHLGEALLRRHGVVPALARFARTHGLSADAATHTIEDLLVIVADTIWKGRRDQTIDDVLTRTLTSSTMPTWKVYDTIDTILTQLAEGADARLDWQRLHPLQ
jgi:hypothetical protein